MSTLLHVVPSLDRAGGLHRAHVLQAIEGADATVQLADSARVISCQVLYTGGSPLTLAPGDEVLVWMSNSAESRGVVLGRTGPYEVAPSPVVPAEEFAARPTSLVLEAQGDVILRNGHAKITLGAKGDVEIACTSFTTRSQRLLRLLAPLIKLN
jgi:hypothetical protein